MTGVVSVPTVISFLKFNFSIQDVRLCCYKGKLCFGFTSFTSSIYQFLIILPARNNQLNWDIWKKNTWQGTTVPWLSSAINDDPEANLGKLGTTYDRSNLLQSRCEREYYLCRRAKPQWQDLFQFPLFPSSNITFLFRMSGSVTTKANSASDLLRSLLQESQNGNTPPCS